MTHTFYLKKPKSNKETLILFSCSFKEEQKKFVYSTGEVIHPKDWDQKSKSPILNSKTPGVRSIRTQLGRYSECFHESLTASKLMHIQFNSSVLKDALDLKFKKTIKGSNDFFNAYDRFISEKTKNKDWSDSTIKRYGYMKTLLLDFQAKRNYKLNFNNINSTFMSEFTDYCLSDKGHINNTFSRNLGLFKTFMLWAYKNRITYNDEFKAFKRKKQVITNQIALTKKDIEQLLHSKCKSKSLERVRDVFIFSCVTGCRFGELKFISKSSVSDDTLYLKEEKGSEKKVREIPLSKIARFILKKYDYNLPLVANQNHNEYIKTVFLDAGFTQKVEKVSVSGKTVTRKAMRFWQRVSSHTARRTFITMMKREGKSDKLISKITGHLDMKTLNTYYQVDNDEKKEAVDQVFNIDFNVLKKA
ncbi:tyrosine-type recombinase/integrase [Nonlabens ponticola]|uniref:Integrase n=1 Tax=Nonlabens ponticola TaxID=2496866 RepID=A0A3S9N0K3_9FLAO|nr:tyrosine-type recombinase/integrase [Nonlabens ponticola]AZQ44852.1 integrase [Nonlabens ponticola]